ncbi:MAG: putative enzyme related to lactoylglutathione lyase [Cellvibrionaceae bacterium]|jgi:predicted enzyme related to lactoylglutathione lyase
MQLKKITIAPVKTAEMVQFYNAVFDAQLEPFSAFGTTLFSGTLAGIELLFCPNEILDIKAEKNRQQLSFIVDDLGLMLQKVQANGGSLMGDLDG